MLASTSNANSLLSLRLSEAKVVEKVSANDNGGSIERLARGLAAGQEAAFRDFHGLYFARLYQFLLVVARGQEQEAQEALQQTMLRVLRYARVFDSEDAFWSWLKVLARSAARDAGRKEQRYVALLRNFALRRQIQVAPPQIPDESGQLFTALEESLSELPATERRLLEAKYVEGESVKELSAQSGLTEKAVESRLLRVRREVRQRLLGKLRNPQAQGRSPRHPATK